MQSEFMTSFETALVAILGAFCTMPWAFKVLIFVAVFGLVGLRTTSRLR